MATTTPTIPPVAEVVAQPSAELTSAQEEWLQRLELCESNGSTTIRIIDTNGAYSTGRYQFQDKTFLTYGKKYGLIATSTTKAEPLIYDGDLQQQLAHLMLVDGGEGHWANCSRSLGSYPH